MGKRGMQIIQSLQVGLRRNWKCDCSIKTCCLCTSCSNDNRATVCLCFRFLWTHLLHLLKFVFSFFFPFLSCCETLNGIWARWISEVHYSVHKPFCPLWGASAAQVWWTQTAEALGLSAGNELKNLGIREDRWVPLLRSRLKYLLAWIKLPLRGETWLPFLHSHVPAVLVCGHESDGREPGWLAMWDAEALGMSLQQE